MGPARFGLATSRLSAGRSNQAKLRARTAEEARARLKRSLGCATVYLHACCARTFSPHLTVHIPVTESPPMEGGGRPASRFTMRLSSTLTERNLLFFLLGGFIVLSILIASMLYLPQTDLYDATTNAIWIDYYSRGIYSVPYSEWTHGLTQSAVVLYNGVYTVVNEKGPGHVMMILPFHVLGVEFLFGPVMMAVAVFSTYMLGKRLLDWPVGFLGAVLVLTNATVLAMWYRYYWTDASTMHTLVLSMWLLVEADYWFNGKSLDATRASTATTRQGVLGGGLGVLSGLAFGASVSTRYATAVIVVAILFYLVAFYLVRAWPHLKERHFLEGLRRASGFWVLLGVFLLGLMCVLVPLMKYNTDYFGGPFRSGYDATSLTSFNPTRELVPRNTSSAWSSGILSSLSTTLGNFGVVLPTLILRVPALLIAPVGIWVLRKKPLILTFLLLWTLINLATYFSLGWMSMYANVPPQVVSEPRYFLPSLPPIAILAGAGVLAVARRAVPKAASAGTDPDRRKARTALVAGAVIGILALGGLIPAAGYFASLGYGGAQLPGPSGAPPGQQPNAVATNPLESNPTVHNGSIATVRTTAVVTAPMLRPEGTSLDRNHRDNRLRIAFESGLGPFPHRA